jgi:hypothetical protein
MLFTIIEKTWLVMFICIYQRESVQIINNIQGSHYFQIRGRSDFSFRELTGRSGRQQREVRRLLGEINCD